jgi:hypothetical protein
LEITKVFVAHKVLMGDESFHGRSISKNFFEIFQMTSPTKVPVTTPKSFSHAPRRPKSVLKKSGASLIDAYFGQAEGVAFGHDPVPSPRDVG